jgi:hypothetical protein
MICLQRPALGLAAMVAILTTGFADSAAAKHPLPFQGQFRALESTETLLPPEVPVPTLIVDASGSGRATLVGRFTLDYEFEVNLENFVGVGSAQFRSGRRDSLTTREPYPRKTASRLSSRRIRWRAGRGGSRARPADLWWSACSTCSRAKPSACSTGRFGCRR